MFMHPRQMFIQTVENKGEANYERDCIRKMKLNIRINFLL